MSQGHSDRSSKARRRVAAAGTAVGAFLAMGMAPLAVAPAAHADVDFGFESLFDSLFESLTADLGSFDFNSLA